jgi:hypothetical protein
MTRSLSRPYPYHLPQPLAFALKSTESESDKSFRGNNRVVDASLQKGVSMHFTKAFTCMNQRRMMSKAEQGCMVH